MSVYSEQINLVINTRLLPKMEALGEEIARIEPYSYSSSILEEYKRQLDYYSMIYDFLYEYVTGTEELESAKLVNVVRLIESNERKRRSSDYLGLNMPANINNNSVGIDIYIDKIKVTESMVLSPGTGTLTVLYTPDSELPTGIVTSVELADGTTITCEGTTCSLQNITIPDTALEFTVTISAGTTTILVQDFSIPTHSNV